MRICGIIAEYNPFHTGHIYHIQQTRKYLGDNCAIVCVMSGNYVQRGSPAVFSKQVRAAAALQNGADVVLELPLTWSLASADRFAMGAVETLHRTGVVQWLSFGSEYPDITQLWELAAAMHSEEIEQRQLQWMAAGFSPPAAKQKAAEEQLGEKSGILRKPNAMLAVSYLRAILSLDAKLQPIAIQRQGASHDERVVSETFASAAYLRDCLAEGDFEQMKPFLPPDTYALLKYAMQKGTGPVFLEDGAGERAMLSRLRSMDLSEFQALPEAGGGLSNRLWGAAKEASSLSELLQQCKTKRYTYAHLRRLVLRAYLGIKQEDHAKQIPYVRVLGFSKCGQAVLALMREKASCPIVVKFADGVKQGGAVAHHLKLEAHATDLYGLCTPNILNGGLEWKTGPVLPDMPFTF